MDWKSEIDRLVSNLAPSKQAEVRFFIENLLEQEREKSRKEQEKADWFGVTSRKMRKSEKEAIIEQERKRILSLPCMEEEKLKVGGVNWHGRHWMNVIRRELKEEINICKK